MMIPNIDAWAPGGPLFDRDASIQARDEALAQVEANANAYWKDGVRSWILQLPAGAVFTSDDAWAFLGDTTLQTHENRAMGAILRSMATLGAIEKTGTYRNSARPKQHAAMLAEWRRR